jgi:hypothetical protein
MTICEYQALIRIMHDGDLPFHVRYDAASRALPYEQWLKDQIAESPKIIAMDRGSFARGMRKVKKLRSKVRVTQEVMQ